MPPPVCEVCKEARAAVIRPKNSQKICKQCFLVVFESEIHETIVGSNLFSRGERVAIGASGGKDSTVLASVLKTLNERHDYGLNLVLLSIDEGIKGYRDDSLETVKRNAEQYEMPLEIVGYDQLYGWTMDQVVAQRCCEARDQTCRHRPQCRRRGRDGHDESASGRLTTTRAATSIVTASAASEIKRSKPLKYAYEKEIVLYAHHKKLDYFSTECIYSPEAFRGSARALIKDLEKIRPSSILDIVRSGEDMAALVPPELGSSISCGAGAEEETNGCGTRNTTGDSMAQMENDLTANAAAAQRETEIKHPTEAKPVPSIHDKKPKGNRKVVRQVMGQCERCGYLSSQKICKACSLLEGLNKSRPQMSIEVGIEDEEGSTTLMRQVAGLEISAG